MTDVSLNKLISISEVRAKISALVETLGKEGYLVITKTGSPVAALVSLPLLEKALGEVPSKKPEGNLFFNAAGMWKDLDVEKMIKKVHGARKDSSSSKEFLTKTK